MLPDGQLVPPENFLLLNTACPNCYRSWQVYSTHSFDNFDHLLAEQKRGLVEPLRSLLHTVSTLR